MTYTSAEAAKLLRALNDELASLQRMEGMSMNFVASLGEDIESIRPKYDYKETQKKINELQSDIRRLKHALNVFNTTHVVPGFDMTVDEMLVYIPQLSQMKDKLYPMKLTLPKTRVAARVGSNIIDYNFANYSIEDVEEDYNKVSDELARAQTALDLLNNTETFEFEL